MQNFADIEILLERLLEVSASEISNSEKSEVQKFIDVGEYGLAVETFADIYAEGEKVASPEVVDIARSLITAMSMDSAELMEKITKKLR